MAQSAQAGLLEFLAKRTGAAVEAKDPIFHESPDLFALKTLALLRLNTPKATGAIVIGFTDTDTEKRFLDMTATPAPAADGAAAPKAKSVESDLLECLFRSIDPEMRANQVTIDPKAVIFVSQKNLSGWAEVATNRSVKFPFNTPSGEVVFEIPILDSAYHTEKTIESFGYTEGTRIMVVDDSATTRRLSRQFLAMAGFLNIIECADGQEAFTKLMGSRPAFELVLADWHMPNMSGLDMLKKVRATPDIKDMPIILATGERNGPEVASAIKERVSGYIVKPFDGPTIYKAMLKTKAAAATKKAA